MVRMIVPGAPGCPKIWPVTSRGAHRTLAMWKSARRGGVQPQTRRANLILSAEEFEDPKSASKDGLSSTELKVISSGKSWQTLSK